MLFELLLLFVYSSPFVEIIISWSNFERETNLDNSNLLWKMRFSALFGSLFSQNFDTFAVFLEGYIVMTALYV